MKTDTKSAANLYAPEVVGADPLMKEDQAAVVLTVAVKTLQHWRATGAGPRYVKLGAGLRAPVRYRLSALHKFVADCDRSSTADHAVKAA